MISVQDFFGVSVSNCDQPAALTNFSAEAYMGDWFGVQHTAGLTFIKDSDVCVQAQYSDLREDGYFWMRNSAQPEDFGTRYGPVNYAYCPDESGQCFIRHQYRPTTKPNYSVLDTDYTSYSIVYKCAAKKMEVFLLAREPVISNELYDQMISIVQEKLPSYDLALMNARDYQGDDCTYRDYETASFLQ